MGACTQPCTGHSACVRTSRVDSIARVHNCVLLCVLVLCMRVIRVSVVGRVCVHVQERDTEPSHTVCHHIKRRTVAMWRRRRRWAMMIASAARGRARLSTRSSTVLLCIYVAHTTSLSTRAAWGLVCIVVCMYASCTCGVLLGFSHTLGARAIAHASHTRERSCFVRRVVVPCCMCAGARARLTQVMYGLCSGSVHMGHTYICLRGAFAIACCAQCNNIIKRIEASSTPRGAYGDVELRVRMAYTYYYIYYIPSTWSW